MGLFTEMIVPVEELQTNAEKIVNLAKNCEDIFYRIEKKLASLRDSGAWVGDGVDELIAATIGNSATYKKHMDEAQKLAIWMREYAKEIQQKDIDLKGRIMSV